MKKIKSFIKNIKLFRLIYYFFRKDYEIFSKFNLNEKSIVLDLGANVGNISQFIEDKFNCKIGYSGHEPSVSPSIAAWMLGADYIERHITLDRAMWGTDQAASLSEVGISQLTGTLFKLPKVFGDGKKILTPKEKELIPKFRYWDK